MNELRVSVATYNQVLLSHPQTGIQMLALEYKATAGKDGNVSLRAQPFGGGIRILDPRPLKEILGEIRFDSERSKNEGDFRILIPPSKWETVKEYCLRHLGRADNPVLEAAPDRELAEEFEETLHVDLRPDRYTVQPFGFVVEDHPVWTENWYAPGFPTVRIYKISCVQIVDDDLCKTMLAASERYSKQELARRVFLEHQRGGQGRANSILVLPLDVVCESYRTLPRDGRYRKIMVEGHQLDESVVAVLEGIEVPQYQRLPVNFVAGTTGA
jgi:hypothetical protein